MLDRITKNVISATIVTLSLAALIIGTMQVALRYIFNTGVPWSEGIFIMLTVWAMLIAGIRAVGFGLHVRVDVGLMLLPPAARRVAEAIGVFAAIALSGYYAYCGALYVQFVWSIDATSAEAYLPVWIIYLIVPISMVGFVIRYLQRIALWRRGGPPPCEEVGAGPGHEHDSAGGQAA
jgi:C4-dicarboxylate transporter, DctQ subunit